MNLMEGGELDWPKAHVVPAARVHNSRNVNVSLFGQASSRSP